MYPRSDLCGSQENNMSKRSRWLRPLIPLVVVAAILATAQVASGALRPIRDVVEVTRTPHAVDPTELRSASQEADSSGRADDIQTFENERLSATGEDVARRCLSGALASLGAIIGNVTTGQSISFQGAMFSLVRGCFMRAFPTAYVLATSLSSALAANWTQAAIDFAQINPSTRLLGSWLQIEATRV
jgi:hypothetical protein